MALKNRCTELLGIEKPIVQGGMKWVGQIQGLIHDVPTCQVLLDRIVDEAEAPFRGRLLSMIAGSPLEAVIC